MSADPPGPEHPQREPAESPRWVPPASAPPAQYAPPPPQYAPPPQYGPQHHYAVPVAPKTNGFAVASMVLGIVWVYWVGSILALVFGYIAMGQIDRSQGRESGRGMAVAGVVLGWVGVGLFVLLVVFQVILVA